MAVPATKFPPIGKMSNDELRRFGMEDLIYLLREVDADRLNMLRDHGNLMRDINKRMQTHLMEIRSLKEVNKKLQDENQEVRDLACFLDDDRQKGRKLAREWQRFGRYTSGVMKSELTTYQDKLKQLEEKQAELLQENIELKELCIYLDQELKQLGRRDSIDRDLGDGSSSSSPIGEKIDDVVQTNMISHPQSQEAVTHFALNEPTLKYIKQLEQRLSRLENNHQTLSQKGFYKHNSDPHLQNRQPSISHLVPSRPASVAQAMKVLEVHEQLEQGPGQMLKQGTEEELDDAEKAIIRQMCNIVWKKIGETDHT